MFWRDRSLKFAILLSLCVTVVILAFLYSKSLDLGFVRTSTTNDLISYITLISAIFGGVFAYKILRATLDQRDVSFMPFLSIVNLNPTNSNLEVNFRNNGSGPAIDIYWESVSSNVLFGKGQHRQDVVMPGDRTGVSRPWADERNKDVSDFTLALTCKDQVGNKYNFVYLIKPDSTEFIGTQKNGVSLT